MQMDILFSTFWLFMFKDLVIFHVLQLFWQYEEVVIFLLSYTELTLGTFRMLC